MLEKLQSTGSAVEQFTRLAAMGQLAGGIAHDFNNLLMIIIGTADMMREDLPADHPSAADVASISSAAGRAATLVRQLSAFGRPRPGETERLDPNAIMRDLSSLLERTLGDDVEVVCELGDDVSAIVVNRSQVEQIVLNLAVNSRHAMPHGGRLTIRTTNVVLSEQVDGAAGPYVRVSVTDTGVGMPPDVAARVFEPFFTTRDVGQGTGMGLAMVHGLMRGCGGLVRLETRVGAGAAFHLFFPRLARDSRSMR